MLCRDFLPKGIGAFGYLIFVHFAMLKSQIVRGAVRAFMKTVGEDPNSDMATYESGEEIPFH